MKYIITHRNRLLFTLGLILFCAFAGSSYLNYTITKSSVQDEIIKTDLPLTMSNIYSEITSQMDKPLLVSSSMASDTFLKEWVLSGERDQEKIINYLSEIKEKYGFFTAFFVSNSSTKYYRYNKLHKVISERSNHDSWYFNFVKSKKEYEYNVDTDQATNHTFTIFLNHRVVHKGELLGVVGVGLKIETVANHIAEYQQKYHRTVYLTDTQGLVQLHPDTSLIKRKNIEELSGIKDITEQIINQATTTENYSFNRDGEHILLNVQYIPSLDWMLYVEQSRTEALLTARKNITRTMVIGFVSTIIIIGLTLITINSYQNKLQHSATTDELTGTLNRRALDSEFGKFSYNFSRTGEPFCAIMVDLDKFKAVNDSLGHVAGDAFLKDITDVFKNVLRPTDALARWGGDEFVILSPNNLSDGVIVAERLKKGVNKYTEKQNQQSTSPASKVSISCGISQFYESDTLDSLILRADQAMYRSKVKGGDQVSV